MNEQMPNALIPELHDVLKITNLQHNFEDFDERFLRFSPNTRSWKGVLQHHCSDRFPAFPTDRETFLLHFSDGLASNFSRHQQSYKGEINFVLHKLWNPHWQGEDLRLKEEGQIVGLLKFLSKDPTYDEFRNRYGGILESRAEDARPGMNITSLETHLTLSGKFFRFLKNSKTLVVQDNEIIPSIDGISKLRDSKMKSWHLHLTRCKFNFNQKPIRARDLNVLSILEEVTSTIEKDFYDNILYSTSGENLIFYDDPLVLDNANSIARKNGLWTAVYHGVLRLDEISRFLKKPKLEGKHIYTLLPDSISPPICEICQMSGGIREWPNDYYSQFGKDPEVFEEGIEYLCPTCFTIRSKPSRLRQLKTWTETEDTDVLWIKVMLNYELLTTVLQQLYWEYLKKSNPSATIEHAEIRFSLISEFYKDYNSFLLFLKNSLFTRFGDSRIEILLKEMFCIKMDRKGDVFLFLQEFNKILHQFFPEFKKFAEAPINVSLVYCHSKFPFFEVWKIIEEPTSNLHISLIGHGTIETSFNHLDDILLAGTSSYRKSALHKLAEISKISERLAELKFQDRSEKSDFESYGALKRRLLPLGMDFSSLLTFSKLLGD
jgi:hypothetical protein